MKLLLERLVDERTAPAGTMAFDEDTAILANIQRLVATRPQAGSDGDFDILTCGVPSVVELARDDAARQLAYAQRIRRLIEHYEPRLEHVRVSLAPTGRVAAPYQVVVAARRRGGDDEPVRFEVRSGVR